jgi:diadenosine tetraphosphate (Ap4A) HIT family hydrolase
MTTEASSFEIFETDHWKVILLEEQRLLGRSVVVLKRPCGDVAELDMQEIADLFMVMRKMQFLIAKTFGARMFNWACNMNNAYQEDPPKPQMHWHCLPRYDRSVSFAGEIFEDANFGHHHLKSGASDRIVPSTLRGQILSELKKNL